MKKSVILLIAFLMTSAGTVQANAVDCSTEDGSSTIYLCRPLNTQYTQRYDELQNPIGTALGDCQKACKLSAPLSAAKISLKSSVSKSQVKTGNTSKNGKTATNIYKTSKPPAYNFQKHSSSPSTASAKTGTQRKPAATASSKYKTSPVAHPQARAIAVSTTPSASSSVNSTTAPKPSGLLAGHDCLRESVIRDHIKNDGWTLDGSNHTFGSYKITGEGKKTHFSYAGKCSPGEIAAEDERKQSGAKTAAASPTGATTPATAAAVTITQDKNGTTVHINNAPGSNSGVLSTTETQAENFKKSDENYGRYQGKITTNVEGSEVETKDKDGNIKIVGKNSGLIGKAEKSQSDFASAQADLDQTRSDFKSSKPKLLGGKQGALPVADGSSMAEHTTRAEYKYEKKVEKQLRNETASDAKKDAKAYATAHDQLEIRETNHDGVYGGKYGGASVEKTQQLNGAVTVMSGAAEQGSQYLMSKKNDAVRSNLEEKGSTATQQDGTEANAQNLDNAVKATRNMGLVTSMMGIMQGTRILSHSQSKRQVDAAAGVARNATNQDLAEQERIIAVDYNAKCATYASNPAAQAACEEERTVKLNQVHDLKAARDKNTKDNLMAEKAAQGSAAFTQGVETAKTLAKATQMYMSASALKSQANALRVNNQPNNGFSYNPGSGNPYNPDGSSAAPADTGAVVDNVAEDGPALDAGNNQINPGLGDPGIGGGGPDGKFVAAPAGAAPSGGGAALGASGGTSAAKDDGSAKPEAPGKNQAGGGYASDGPAGSGYRGSGGANAGVGVDNSFADMLKKFLPGGDEEKKKEAGAMAFDDRSPASDQAAVIGRNKNIFEEIHKRYQKKSGEGAIVF